MGGRFSGWNNSALVKLDKKYSEIIPKTKKTKAVKPVRDYVGEIVTALIALGIDASLIKREYKFCEDRRFRFDLALPSYMIAVEYEGGVHSGGRHVRGKGYATDCKKYNLAAMYGWTLLRFTSDDFKGDFPAFAVAGKIKQLIEAKNDK